ncbi:hypothetical protein OH77DRAFT_1553381, partial [Trametes cingulata]
HVDVQQVPHHVQQTHVDVQLLSRHLQQAHVDVQPVSRHVQQAYVDVQQVPHHVQQAHVDVGLLSTPVQQGHVDNSSSLRAEDPIDVRSFLQKVHDLLTDHVEDQKGLKKLFAEWRRTSDHELCGERAMAELAPLDLLPILAEEAAAGVEHAGGAEAWAQLDSGQLETANLAIRKAIITHLGKAAYNDLPESERGLVDLFIHAGCCMPKELNSIKGGNTRLMAFWEKSSLQAPCLLMNRDNDAAASCGSSVAKRQAEERSCRGAVKLSELAGALFRHKDDKKGQQDAVRYFFEATLGFQFKLLVHLQYYWDFLELVRDKKDSGTFNHMEHNVWKGLHDLSTLTELCVLALYTQSISHPYMREARGPQNGLTNHLDLGPLHARLKAHMACIVADPEILLAPDASYEGGSLDGHLWEWPEVLITVHQLAPTLPHLPLAVSEFVAGALDTWGRFSAEFAPGWTIARLTKFKRQLAWMPSTNDENEGSSGTLRILARITLNVAASAQCSTDV